MFPKNYEKYVKWLKGGYNCPPDWHVNHIDKEMASKEKGIQYTEKPGLMLEEMEPMDPEYPNQCPVCKRPSYHGLLGLQIRCSNPYCENYEERGKI